MNERLKGKLRRALEVESVQGTLIRWTADYGAKVDVEAIIDVVEEVMDGKMRVVDRT